MFSKIRKNKEHITCLILLFLICAFVLHDYVAGPYWVPMRGDPQISGTGTDFAYHASNAVVLKNSLAKLDIPLWSPYTLSGMPFFAKPQVQVFNPTWIFLLIAPTAWLGLKWSYLFHLFMAGVGMYFFMLVYMKQEHKISFLSSLVYMLNGNLISEIVSGHMNILNVYAWLPFIVLFTLLALNSRKWISYSILAGISCAFLIFGGSPQEAMFVVFLLIVIISVNLIGEHFFSKLVKSFFVGFVLFIVFLSVAAIKILPTLELLKVTGSRESGMPFEALAATGIFGIGNLIAMFGIIGIILLPFAFLSIRKKKILLIFLLALFAISILSNSPVIYFLWKYVPFVNKMRGINKVIFLFAFPVSALLGIAASNLLSISQKKINITGKYYLNGIYALILAAVLVNLAIFGPKQVQFDNINFQLEKNQVMQYMNKDNGLFRFKVYETNGIDWGTDYYSIPLGLQDIYGYDNTWLIRYMPVFLSVANREPAKIFGMLNMKYMTSTNPLNISGFSLVKKFEKCGFYGDGTSICQPSKSDGPYLYKNDLFLPRAYFAEKAVLVLGDANNADRLVFFLIANPKFNPAKTVVINEPSLQYIDLGLLQKFNAVILLQNPSQDDIFKLKNYADGAGTLLPNIFAKENQLSEEKINSILLLNETYSNVKNIGVKYKDFENAAIDLEGEHGFLVISEQYSQYPGWTALIGNSKLKIFKADGIISAVYVDAGKEKLTFKYSPDSYRTGKLISIIAIVIILGFFVFNIILKKSLFPTK